MTTLLSSCPQETLALGEQWGRAAQPGWVIGLTGDLGAGKTHLVKGIARGLGFQDRIRSPTFALVHEYTGGRLPLYHLDLYRIEQASQVLALGIDDLLDQDAVLFAENFQYPARLTLVAPGDHRVELHGPHLVPLEHGDDLDALLLDSIDDSVASLDDLAQASSGKLGHRSAHRRELRQPTTPLDDSPD